MSRVSQKVKPPDGSDSARKSCDLLADLCRRKSSVFHQRERNRICVETCDQYKTGEDFRMLQALVFTTPGKLHDFSIYKST